MKSKLRLLVLVLMSGCGGQQQAQYGAATSTEIMALGWVDRAVLDQPQFSQFRTTYDTVKVNEVMVDLIRQASDNVEWLVFFGTWCGDSRRQMPLFLKVADSAGIPGQRIRLFGLDRSLKDHDGLAEKYQIRVVPTFVVLKAGKEIGRISEAPSISMEADILNILAAAP